MNSVLGVLLAAVVLGLFYLVGGMGMGDVKLFAAWERGSARSNWSLRSCLWVWREA